MGKVYLNIFTNIYTLYMLKDASMRLQWLEPRPNPPEMVADGTY